jgi:hypothetical protein
MSTSTKRHNGAPDTTNASSVPEIKDTGLRYRTLPKSKSTVFLPRLVNRDLAYNQSKNTISIANERHHEHVWPLLMRDWFHVLLRTNVFISLTGLLVIWSGTILLFALVYVQIDQNTDNLDCGLGEAGMPIPWATAFAFSLETCTTVGCKYIRSVVRSFCLDVRSVRFHPENMYIYICTVVSNLLAVTFIRM